MDEVEAQLDTATALAFGLLCASGVHQPESLLAYARKLDAIFSRITATPAIVAALHLQPEVRAEAPFEAQLGLLLEVQTALWRLKPNRVSGDFLLTQVIDSYTDNRPGAGNSLGLALLDSYIIGRLGLPVRCLTEHDVLRLEIELAGRRVYWEVLEPMPVSLVPVAPGHRMGRTDLIALYYASLGTYCFVQGRWDKAMEMYRRSLALKPDAAATHVSVAMCLLRREQPSEAIRVLHRAQDLAPNAPEAHYHEGNAYAVMKHWPKAAGAYKRALALRPEYAEAANNLGLAYANMDAPDKAELAFNQARQARPDYYQAIFNLGNLLLDRRRFDEAIDAYREVCRLEPNYAAARYNMGRAYYEMHDLDGSINCYRKAVQLNPRHFGAWHNLGIAYRDKGLVDKAVEALERAVTLNPCLMR
jgi:tetratricopeptide (TPR) repeat protein